MPRLGGNNDDAGEEEVRPLTGGGRRRGEVVAATAYAAGNRSVGSMAMRLLVLLAVSFIVRNVLFHVSQSVSQFSSVSLILFTLNVLTHTRTYIIIIVLRHLGLSRRCQRIFESIWKE